MRVLMIGGTIFAGRHTVEALLARGHDVVLFNRGKAAAGLFPQLERVRGDRVTDIARLGERRFDAVIDTCGYLPHVVSTSAAYLSERAGRYLFISSISAYDPTHVPADESAPLAKLPQGVPAGTFAIEQYGALKALCEGAATAAFGPQRTIVVRPGLIVGPHDPTDRFSYWPHRIARGGDVLAPNDPSDIQQFVDVRDLADWIVRLLETGAHGAFNAVSPPRAFTIGDVLAACAQAAGSSPRFVWVDEAFLEARGVEAYSELPLWVPASAGFAGFFEAGSARAVATGLQTRPLLETARDTLAWLSTRPPDHAWKGGLTPEREAQLLTEWHAERAPVTYARAASE
jgi:2'-hydroxyisoflavone reductase